MTFYIPDGLDDNGATIDMDSRSSGLIGKINEYVKGHTKSVLAAAGFAASTLFTMPAEAQMRQRSPNTVITGTAIPRPGPMIDPGNIPADWMRFADGVDRRSRFFSGGVILASGGAYGFPYNIPFFDGVPGHYYGNLWFPLFYGPLFQPWSYGASVYAQLDNVSRPYPPIGAYGPRSFGVSRYGYGEQPSMTTNGDTYIITLNNRGRGAQQHVTIETNKGQNARISELESRVTAQQLELEKLRQEEARPERPLLQIPSPEPQPPVPPEPTHQRERSEVNIPYGGNIAHVQYDDTATHFYNDGLFAQIRKLSDGDINLFAFDEGRTIAIKDGNDGYKTLLSIDILRYPRCLHRDVLLDRLTSEILRLEIDSAKVYAARAGVDIERGTYPDACRQ